MNAKELIEAAERMNEEWNINRIASEDLQAVVNTSSPLSARTMTSR